MCEGVSMKSLYIAMVLSAFILIGCVKGEPMVLLDEPIKAIHFSTSKGVGEMNETILFSIKEDAGIKTMEKVILTAVQEPTVINEQLPDYDVMVEYKKDLPTHAIHLWVGEQDEPSVLMYMVSDGQTFLTTGDMTNSLREIIVK